MLLAENLLPQAVAFDQGYLASMLVLAVQALLPVFQLVNGALKFADSAAVFLAVLAVLMASNL